MHVCITWKMCIAELVLAKHCSCEEGITEFHFVSVCVHVHVHDMYIPTYMYSAHYLYAVGMYMYNVSSDMHPCTNIIFSDL